LGNSERTQKRKERPAAPFLKNSKAEARISRALLRKKTIKTGQEKPNRGRVQGKSLLCSPSPIVIKRHTAWKKIEGRNLSTKAAKRKRGEKAGRGLTYLLTRRLAGGASLSKVMVRERKLNHENYVEHRSRKKKTISLTSAKICRKIIFRKIFRGFVRKKRLQKRRDGERTFHLVSRRRPHLGIGIKHRFHKWKKIGRKGKNGEERRADRAAHQGDQQAGMAGLNKKRRSDGRKDQVRPAPIE